MQPRRQRGRNDSCMKEGHSAQSARRARGSVRRRASCERDSGCVRHSTRVLWRASELRTPLVLGSARLSSPTFLGNDDGNALVVGQHQTAVPTPRTHREGVTGSEHQNDCCPTIAPLALDVLGAESAQHHQSQRSHHQRQAAPNVCNCLHLPIRDVKCNN